VWDAEVFAVSLMDVVPDDQLAQSLCGLIGVQQIALEASRLAPNTLIRPAKIHGLTSLVLNHADLTDNEIASLGLAGLEIILVSE
jgi:hypothetical protein